MQDFRGNEKKQLKMKFVMGFPCVSSYIWYYVHRPSLLLCF